MYLFTAAQTELGKSEEWFWNVTPKKLIAMLNEKKKADQEKSKMVAFFMCGGTLDEKQDSRGIPGIDFPADDFSLGQ